MKNREYKNGEKKKKKKGFIDFILLGPSITRVQLIFEISSQKRLLNKKGLVFLFDIFCVFLTNFCVFLLDCYWCVVFCCPPRHPKLGLNVGFCRISWLILRERLCFVGAWVSVDLFTWAATDIPVCDVPPAFD
jgi:hypothetical protein